MTPTSFEFTLTMPGDSRLVGAARQLAAQAAVYAQMSPDEREGLAGHVERATRTAIASAPGSEQSIELRFSGDQGAVNVTISCDAKSSVEPPHASLGGGLSVAWSTDDSRLICHIRQRISS